MEMRDLNNRVIVREFPLRLDLGCGPTVMEGFHGMDWQDYGQDIKWNAVNGIPLPDGSVCEIYTSHFLEHLNWEQFYVIVMEMMRVCANNARIVIQVPHGDVIEGHLICHYIRITEMTFQAMERNMKPWDKVNDPNYISPMQLIKTWRREYHLLGEFKINK